MHPCEIENSPFLIIGGTTKAGTTSLYTYFAGHPQVCPSTLKETRFFLDGSYPLPVKHRFSEGLGAYANFFSHCDHSGKQLFMEATPDYLYSVTAQKIGDLLPKARIVFILRDPIDRLLSWFKFAKQRGMLKDSVTFEEYVRLQIDNPVTESTPVHLRALEQGCYAKYLSPFLSAMGDRVLVVSFEMFKKNPELIVKEISSFAGIDGSYFDGFSFSVENESKKVRLQMLESSYRAIRRRVAFLVHNNEQMLSFFRWINRYFKMVLRFNSRPVEGVEITGNLLDILREYYADEIVASDVESKHENNASKGTSGWKGKYIL